MCSLRSTTLWVSLRSAQGQFTVRDLGRPFSLNVPVHLRTCNFSLKRILKINQQTISGNRITFGSYILSKNPGAHLSVPWRECDLWYDQTHLSTGTVQPRTTGRCDYSCRCKTRWTTSILHIEKLSAGLLYATVLYNFVLPDDRPMMHGTCSSWCVVTLLVNFCFTLVPCIVMLSKFFIRQLMHNWLS